MDASSGIGKSDRGPSPDKPLAIPLVIPLVTPLVMPLMRGGQIADSIVVVVRDHSIHALRLAIRVVLLCDRLIALAHVRWGSVST